MQETGHAIEARDDSPLRPVESVQHATLNRPGYGLDPNPALFGSDEWWQSVADGRVPSKVEEGVVADVRWASMGDWPEWRFLSDDGRETTWTREGDHTRYVTGLRARIRVATVRWKADSQMVRKLGRDPEHDILLKVELEASDRRSERLGPGPFPGAYDDVPSHTQTDDSVSERSARGSGCCVDDLWL